MTFEGYIEKETQKIVDKLRHSDTFGEGMDGLLSLVKQGNGSLVHNYIEEMIESWPQMAVLLNSINAWLYTQVGNREKALQYYQNSYNLYPTKDSLREIFDCYYFMEKYCEALPIAEKIVKEYGKSHKILVVKTKLKMLNHEEAIKFIEECLEEIDTFENKFVEETLAFAGAKHCFEIGLYDKALLFLDRAQNSLKIGDGNHITKLRMEIIQKSSL